MFDRADAWRDSPVTRERMVKINQLTQAFFSRAFPDSWAQDYLIDRLNVDLTDHPTVLPGYAPAGWTHLVHHLRRLGVTDQEMITAGVARTASTGRLIDAFRDRLMLPITHDGGHPRLRRTPPPPARPRARHRRPGRWPEVPEHLRDPAVPQGRPVLRRSPGRRSSR